MEIPQRLRLTLESGPDSGRALAGRSLAMIETILLRNWDDRDVDGPRKDAGY